MNQFFSIFLIYKWQDFSYVFKVEKLCFRHLVNELLRDLKLKSESKITPRLVTSDLIKGVNFPKLLNSISLFVLGPTSISVLSSFNFKKLLLIHLFIATRQVVMEFIAAASFGSAEMYSCVSSP